MHFIATKAGMSAVDAYEISAARNWLPVKLNTMSFNASPVNNATTAAKITLLFPSSLSRVERAKEIRMMSPSEYAREDSVPGCTRGFTSDAPLGILMDIMNAERLAQTEATVRPNETDALHARRLIHFIKRAGLSLPVISAILCP